MFRARLAVTVLLAASTSTCSMGSILSRNGAALMRAPRRVSPQGAQPFRSDARLSVLWVGHATALVQIDDKLILTDPVFTDTVGQLSRRLVAPGIEPAALPRIDAALISHMHFDHLSPGSLEMIEEKIGFLVVPQKGTVYVPDFAFETVELETFASYQRDGLRITAVPVKHGGFRWGLDGVWMDKSFTGYVIEHHGITVYFGGDTAYVKDRFQETRVRFPSIDLALLPIAPIHPRGLMESRHMSPREAVSAFRDLGARWMVPIHFGTFVNSTDAPGEELAMLRQAIVEQGVDAGRVCVLAAGGQRVFLPRGGF